MKNIQLVTLATLFLASSAFGSGNGVGKTLPSDGHNARIQSADLAQIATGETFIMEGDSGPVYDATYTTKLYVTVTYESKDDSDAPKAGSGSDFGFVAGDSTLPTVSYTFDLLRLKLKQFSRKN